MDDELVDVEAPPPLPACTPEEILIGLYVDPIDRIARYSDKKFEEMVEEWAFYYLRNLKREYKRVRRLGGSGDVGPKAGRDEVRVIRSSAARSRERRSFSRRR
jgi:hypothetical protein